MSQIKPASSADRFKIRLLAPHFTQAPPYLIAKWRKQTKASALKQYQTLKKVIKTKRDFDQKIGKPAEQPISKFIKRGKYKKKQDIMNKTRESLKRASKRYFLEREQTYRKVKGKPAKKYREAVDFGVRKFEASWLKYNGPLQGDNKLGIKGLGPLGAMTLIDHKDLKKSLKKGIDKIIIGTELSQFYCVTSRNKAGRFRQILGNQILRSGRDIITSDYDEKIIQDKNKELNQLVNKYCLPKFAQFSPNGESHIDFIVVEIPDPAKPTQTKKWLALDIQVAHPLPR